MMHYSSLKNNEPIAPYTYSKIGGKAEFLYLATSLDGFIEAVLFARRESLRLTILGSASNVVISDEGLKGLVIVNRCQSITHLGAHITTASGTIMNQLVNYSLSQKLAGLEDFLGIPGTVGGAVYNNSHHLNHLIGDYIESVTALDTSNHQITLFQKECQFSYDDSIFQHQPLIVLSVVFKLQSVANSTEIKFKASQALKRRRDSQPLEYPSPGCMFKNVSHEEAEKAGMPTGVVAAGWLVDHAGCKGLSVGGAYVSDKHANFIVNHGGATASDYVALSNLVRRRVYDRFGVWLNREIFFIGDHPQIEK